MTAFSSVAELGVGEAPGAIFSMSCAAATFSVAAQDTAAPVEQADSAPFSLFVNAAVLSVQIDSVVPTLTGSVAEFALAEAAPLQGVTLNAQTAFFTLSGTDAASILTWESLGASFSLTLQDSQIAWPQDPALFAFTGQDITATVLGAADFASFSLTPGDAQIAWPQDTASFSVALQDSAYAVSLSADAASFNLFGGILGGFINYDTLPPSGTGAIAEFALAEFDPVQIFGTFAATATFTAATQDVTFTAFMPADLASFALSTGEANIAVPHDVATFTATGQDALFQTILPAEFASYTLTGGEAGIIWPQDGATFSFDAQDARFDIRMPMDFASFSLDGQISDYFAGVRAPFDPAVYTVSGQDALFSIAQSLEAGQFTFYGQDALFPVIYRLFCDTANFLANGQDAGDSYIIGGETAYFSLTSPDIPLARVFPSDGASFALTLQDAGATYLFKFETALYTVLGWAVADAVGPSGDHIFLVEVQAHDGSSLQSFYLATAGWTSAPIDTPANQFYEPRVVDPGNFERALFSSGETRGRSSVGAGDIVLANSDPGDGTTLDAWLEYGWDGRPITIKALPVGAKSLAAASTLFRGRLSKLTATRPLDAVSLQIADRLSDLDKPLLTTLFAGTTTSTGATAEGNADLKGKVKQRVYGSVYEIPLQPANPYDLIYLASDKGFNSITVYDGGVALTNAGDDANITALRSASISAGQYRTCKSAGLVRLGGTPVYALTADVVEGASAGDRTAAQIARRMLLDFGIPSNEIITGAFSALDSKNSAVTGVLIDDDRTALTATSEILDSIGGWLVPSRDGSFETNRFEEPNPGPALTFNLESQAIGDSLDRVDGEIPVYRVTLKYRRVYTVQNDSQLAGSVSAERRAYVGSEWRTVVAEDASVKVKHLNARELTIETYLTTQSDAQAEADRLLALYKVERSRYEVAVPLSDGWAGDVGLALTLYHPTRLGMSGGKAFNIIGRVDDYASERVRFQVWG